MNSIRTFAATATVALAVMAALSSSGARPVQARPVGGVAQVVSAPAADEATAVSMKNNRFISDFTMVPVGTTVTFRNDETNPFVLHDVYSDDGVILSPVIAPGESWTFTFSTEGFWHILCSFHPGMEADVLIVAP